MSAASTLDTVELGARLVCGAAFCAFVLFTLAGLVRRARRPRGRKVGQGRVYLKPSFLPLFILGLMGGPALFYALWKPLPVALSEPARWATVASGALLFLGGQALTLWGRAALGEMWDVSSSFGAELYEGHRLVTTGPFALMRHPMYAGWLLTLAGGLLLYRTWAVVLMLVSFPSFVLRARREEEVLAAEFGEQWEAYRRRVPRWIPQPWRVRRAARA